MNIFEKFENGRLETPTQCVYFKDVPWSWHAKFEGVALKHLITSTDTDGSYSYHLVRISPGKKSGIHIHETQLETHEIIAGKGTCINNGTEIVYEEGVICIIQAGIEHEVIAENQGLYLFAKFMPALC